MKKNHYAVVIGRKPSIYASWEEARQQVHEFPNPVYKGFNTFDEAKEYFLKESQERGLNPTEIENPDTPLW